MSRVPQGGALASAAKSHTRGTGTPHTCTSMRRPVPKVHCFLAPSGYTLLCTPFSIRTVNFAQKLPYTPRHHPSQQAPEPRGRLVCSPLPHPQSHPRRVMCIIKGKVQLLQLLVLLLLKLIGTGLELQLVIIQHRLPVGELLQRQRPVLVLVLFHVL